MDQLSAAAIVTQRHVGTCVEIKLQAAHAIDAMLLRSCVCSMAWSFWAIDATLAP